MLETSARLLRLLSLLQTPREWSGTELARRLGVTTRTVRNDVERLRRLGYPVDAARGPLGGYRLGAGSSLPPLLLDDEEAVAVAVGLRTATGGSVAGIEESSLRALAKLEQVLPPRLRRRVGALGAYTVAAPPDRGPAVSPEVLTTLVTACRDRERLRFDYRAHDRTASRRDVEPYRLVNRGRRWYLIAWDTAREDWRTFRVDRIEPKVPTGPRFAPRPLPDEDLAAYVTRGVGSAVVRYRARVLMYAPAQEIAERLPAGVGQVEALGEGSCAVTFGASSAASLAVWLGALGVDFDASQAPELAAELRLLAERYARASGSAQGRPAGGESLPPGGAGG
ncbi:helix-turn-helix transcriptional regulator [Streptomyces hoynatensis]|uniref:YafY family transcriptional regulator n=1 Tax=Streptomyces hoynatensis TaxID=1141874 RepID=A0A3A9Z3I9_9ACTN|nr:YafY family protein [Streptomyces hoynatensis]RKN43011.1 YafY family transcriptional regulator [Streptomyces hoynatensis]